MKKLFTLMVCSLFFVGAFAQTKVEKQVAAAVEAMRKAMVDGDRAMLDKLADEKLTYGHSGGKVENKASFVENIANGNSDFLSIDLTNQTIDVQGKTAIVRHTLTGNTHDKGKDPGTVNLYIITVWVKHGSDWKMLARQAVKFPK